MNTIRFGLLGLLEEEPGHGYGLWRRFEERVGNVWELNVGTVYQNLPALEQQGLVRCAPSEEADEQPRGDRPQAKRPFEITPKGTRMLQGWARRTASAVEPTRDRMLILLLVLATAQPALAVRHIESKERVYRQHLVRMRKRQRRIVKESKADPIVPLLSLDFAILRAKAYLTWLERCRLVLESREIDAVWPDEED